MLSLIVLQTLVGYITYKHNWSFRVGELGDGFFLQVVFKAPDTTALLDESEKEWHGRKWYVSKHSTREEVVQTALKAVLTAEEHTKPESSSVTQACRYFNRMSACKRCWKPHFTASTGASHATTQTLRIPLRQA